MSQYDHIKGKLKAVKITGHTLEDTCRLTLQRRGITPDPKYDSEFPYEFQLMDECPEEFMIYDGVLYQIYEKQGVDTHELFEATIDPSGAITFEVCFWNRSCSLEEAIKTAIKKMINTKIK